MTIYLDVIWLLNFCTDYLLLTLTGILLKRKMRKKRLVIGSLIASLYVFFIFSPVSGFFYHPLVKIFFSMVIVVASFGFKRFSYFLQNVAMFYLVTFMIGGGLLAVHYILLTDSQLLSGMTMTKSNGFGDPVSWGFVMIGFPVLWFFSRQRIQHLDVRKLTYDRLAKVEIQIEDKVFRLDGLIDSGNQLHDPVSRAPVMILDINCVEFPQAIMKRVQQPFSPSEEEHRWNARLRLIPYRSIGGEQPFLLAVRPDHIRIFQAEKVYKVKQTFVGLSEQQLSSDGDFQCIIHPKMLLEANENAS